MKLDEFWERFQSVERKTKALDFKVLGFQIWPLLRTKMFYQISSQIGIFDSPHPNPEPQEAGVPFEPKKAKSIVVPFSRKVNGEDPYSSWLSEHLPDPLFIEHSGDGGLDSYKPSFNEKYEEHVARAMRRLVKKDIPDKWRMIIEGFEKEFGVEIKTYGEYPKWFIRRSIVEALGFRSLFRKTKARKLYIVNAYSHPTVVLGAKLANIRVYELQHGFVSELHPAYSYPDNKKIQSLPHVFLCWGGFWQENLSPAKNMLVKVLGAPKGFWQQMNRPMPKKEQVLFTSQGAVGKKLFALAESFAMSDKKLRVIFRLHPNEDPASYVTDVPNLEVSHKTPPFLDLVGSCEYLVGGFSTTLFEGAALGCKVIVADVPGIENIKKPIEAGEFALLKDHSPRSIHGAMAEAKTVDAKKYYSRLRPEALNA